jgi:DNA-directed RNA polymerase subunit M/transcription elongation factor TFIIS
MVEERRNKFFTEYSKNIDDKIIKMGLSKIKLSDYTKKISSLGYSNFISNDIVDGLFEFSLITIITDDLDENLFEPTFIDKFNDIYLNLNPNGYLKNETLQESIKNKNISAKFLAFMSPQQIFPEKWEKLYEKQKRNEDSIKNMATSNLYKCYRCGKSKCIITQIQTRSADEPSTKFIRCVECGSVFTKS